MWVSSSARACAVRTLWSSSATSPKKRAGAELEQRAGSRRDRNLDPAAEHDEKALALLSLVEDHLVGEVLPLVEQIVDHRQFAQREVLEEHHALEQLEARIAGRGEAEHVRER